MGDSCSQIHSCIVSINPNTDGFCLSMLDDSNIHVFVSGFRGTSFSVHALGEACPPLTDFLQSSVLYTVYTVTQLCEIKYVTIRPCAES